MSAKTDTGYLALVDTEIVNVNEEQVRKLFQGGLFEGVETIGTFQYQLQVGVQAPNDGEAYRKAVNLVEAMTDAFEVAPDPVVIGVTLYPPDGKRDEVVFD